MRVKTGGATRSPDPYFAVRSLIERGYPGVRQAVLYCVATRKDRTTRSGFRDKRTQAARSAHPHPNPALIRFEQRGDVSNFVASALGQIMFDAPVLENAVEPLSILHPNPQRSSPVLNDRRNWQRLAGSLFRQVEAVEHDSAVALFEPI